MDIHILAKAGDCEGILKLLDCGDLSKARAIAAQKDSLCRTPLHLAAFFGHTNAVDLLLSYCEADCVAVDGFTPLHFASQRGNVDVIRRLASQGNINRKTFKSLTALHLASLKNQEGSIKELIRKGADILAKTRDGKTFQDLISDDAMKSRINDWISSDGGVSKRTRFEKSGASAE